MKHFNLSFMIIIFSIVIIFIQINNAINNKNNNNNNEYLEGWNQIGGDSSHSFISTKLSSSPSFFTTISTLNHDHIRERKGTWPPQSCISNYHNLFFQVYVTNNLRMWLFGLDLDSGIAKVHVPIHPFTLQKSLKTINKTSIDLPPSLRGNNNKNNKNNNKNNKNGGSSNLMKCDDNYLLLTQDSNLIIRGSVNKIAPLWLINSKTGDLIWQFNDPKLSNNINPESWILSNPIPQNNNNNNNNNNNDNKKQVLIVYDSKNHYLIGKQLYKLYDSEPDWRIPFQMRQHSKMSITKDNYLIIPFRSHSGSEITLRKYNVYTGELLAQTRPICSKTSFCEFTGYPTTFLNGSIGSSDSKIGLVVMDYYYSQTGNVEYQINGYNFDWISKIYETQLFTNDLYPNDKGFITVGNPVVSSDLSFMVIYGLKDGDFHTELRYGRIFGFNPRNGQFLWKYDFNISYTDDIEQLIITKDSQKVVISFNKKLTILNKYGSKIMDQSLQNHIEVLDSTSRGYGCEVYGYKFECSKISL